jgi:DNA polymerase-1
VKKEIYIIDGSAYIYRAYHAIAPLSNSAGLATNAVLGFVNMVTRLRKERQPDYLAIAFDSKGPVFRHQLYDRYKANRPPMPEDLQQQIPYIKKFVEAANILTLETQGVEADDIIASIVRSFTSKGHRVIIVSGDKDLLQLVTDDVVMFDPMKDQDMSPADVQKKYGVTVEQLLDFFALVGDSADNIPGIPGVGPKTAEKLIGTFGSLEGLYERVEEMKKSKMKEKIIASREQAFLSRDLIALKADVEVPGELSAYKVEEGASDKLVALYTELEFSSLLKNVDTSSKIATEGFSTIRTTEQLEN